MLDTETKRRIDDCRDILVGKLPDPKAQIEQITIGLIYKFMDDMDKEAIELGGGAKFFSGDYKIYSWDALFDTKVTAQQMLDLYSAAIMSMDKNPNIPQLFRDIFKNAFLPYRDAETLKLFLKTINKFEYTHSEKLGDAFEYLLSVMGSQGDAGQFRTPRHIIDFIVSVVNPDKNESVFDPACGTAGFLISAYRNILLKNTKENKNDLNIFEYNKLDEKPFNNLGNTLTPDNRKRLIENFTGYDISPDMVRLSLVNMYLHGFQNPGIVEYDTLTSEERWNESFDVILANPPFMSPKGGIRPHKKFTVKSNRSEVLFVDYIAEHLNPKGRAGVIVPEGIIFQSGTAYKDLRKMLVENYLYAVVSLPAGVFNPYSGVKTSILLMDKEFAKKSNEILFVKIENDGYSLGAQRKEIKGNQLEEAVEILKEFVKTQCIASPQNSIASQQANIAAVQYNIAHTVPKTDIAANGEYNLSGERYKVLIASSTSYDLVPIEEIFELIRNGRNVNQFDENGKYRVTRIQTIADKKVDLEKTKWTNDEVPDDYFMQEGDILLSHINSFEHLAKSAIFSGINEKVVHGTNLIRFKPNKKKVVPEYIYSIFRSEIFINKAKSFAQKAVNQASLRIADLKTIQIPLPPLSVQQEIVEEIESYQKIIDGARQVVENYKPRIDIDPEWEMVELGNVCEIKAGGTPSRDKKEYWEGYIPWFSSGELNEVHTNDPKEFITKKGLENSNASLFPKGSLLIGMYDTAAFKMSILDREATFNQAVCGVKPNENIDQYFLMLYLIMNKDEYLRHRIGVRQRNLNKGFISEILIPKISLESQKRIVSQIEKEQELVNANKQLIKIFEQKIKDRIAKVWGN